MKQSEIEKLIVNENETAITIVIIEEGRKSVRQFLFSE